ncbi:LysR family transcriptional regulator [Rhodococcus sp. 14C212]|uniref:LysR substrate-binding domain-containing protein n=1 Tax=Rhodococcus sp. 14C212 TaxID=2711209 RepID=UPI0013EC7C32|nr:LysR family transcriptional regulator [Rhodococcus sp. 14C212]
MEVRQARHFLAIVDHGTTGRAAAVLHMTQPALSQSIVSLERELRVPLFTRSSRGMQLTPSGEALVRPARRLIESSIRAVAAVEESKDVPRGTLNISVMPALAAIPVSMWTARFRERYPQVSVHLDPYFGEDPIVKHFGKSPVEVLVSFSDESVSGNLRRLEIDSQEMVFVLPPGTVVTDEPAVNIKEIAHCPFVVAPPHTSMRRILDQEFAHIGAELKIAVESPFMDTLPTLVAAGAGCAVVPAQGAERFRELGAIVKHPDPPINRPFYMYYSIHRLSYAAQAFIKMAKADRRQ